MLPSKYWKSTLYTGSRSCQEISGVINFMTKTKQKFFKSTETHFDTSVGQILSIVLHVELILTFLYYSIGVFFKCASYKMFQILRFQVQRLLWTSQKCISIGQPKMVSLKLLIKFLLHFDLSLLGAILFCVKFMQAHCSVPKFTRTL